MENYTKYISSPQNPKIKEVLELQAKSSTRRQQGLFVVEGAREIGHCLEAGFELRSIFHCPSIMGRSAAAMELDPAIVYSDCSFEVSQQVYNKLAYRESTEGIVAVFRQRNLSLEQLSLSSNPLIIVVESVEKPGNLGAILRSADAAGADALIVCEPLTDLYNPNLIRASIGAVFSVQSVCCSSDECIKFLKDRGIKILTAQLQDSSLYYDSPMDGPCAIVMGTESTGLRDDFRKAADAHIRIPMLGKLDSLNVSVSAAILLFEAVRQRNK